MENLGYVMVDVEWLLRTIKVCISTIEELKQRKEKEFHAKLHDYIQCRNTGSFSEKLSMIWRGVPKKYPTDKVDLEKIMKQIFDFDWVFRNYRYDDALESLNDLKKLANTAISANEKTLYISDTSSKLLVDFMTP